MFSIEFSWLDLLTIIGVLIGSLYYFYGKKSSEPSTATILPVGTSRSTTPALTNVPAGFLGKMQQMSKRIIIFFGSQTGTAEEYAGQLAKQAAQYGIGAIVADFMDYDMDELKQMTQDYVAFFVLATYGEGEPTDNAQEFYDWLMGSELTTKSSSFEGDLCNLRYCIFGLGNSTYTKFNEMARQVDKRLMALGAVALSERGEGDDDGNLEEDFMQWKEKMWKEVCSFLQVDPNKSNGKIIRSYNFVKLHEGKVEQKKIFHGEHGSIGSWDGNQNRVSYNQQHPYYAPLVKWRHLFFPGLTEEALDGNGNPVTVPRECIHLEIDISGTSLRYQAGDHLGVFPSNDFNEVEDLAKALGVQDRMDTVFEMRALEGVTSNKKSPFPVPTTIKAALSYYVDITSLPRMSLLSLMARFAKDEKEAEHLKKISSDKDAYHEYIVDPCRNLTQVLLDHPGFKISDEDYTGETGTEESKERLYLGDLFELLPRLHPRFYSISSSSKVSPNVVSLTVSVLRYYTKLGRFVRGVTTGYLRRLCEDFDQGKQVRVPVFVRSSKTFHLPRNMMKPVIMVGPGTGVAPFRGFIQERASLLREKIEAIKRKDGNNWANKPNVLHPPTSSGSPGKLVTKRRFPEKNENEDTTIPQSHKMMGETILFFGSRHRRQDFLYAEEFTLENEFLHDGLTRFYGAFSREVQRKTYVQHLMEEDGENIWSLLCNGAVVYVCGDGKRMARDMQSTLLLLAQKHGNLDEAGAKQWFNKLRSQSCYYEDVWS